MAASTGLFGLGSWTWRSSQAIDQEIDEELDFHLECRKQELMATGLDADAAEDEARRLFGSRDRIRRQCQQAVYGRSLWLMLSLGLAAVLSITAIGTLSYQLMRVNQQNATMHALLAVLQPKPDGDRDLVGRVTDAKGEPIDKAKVLVIYKSWPDGRYRQRGFHQTTDKDGRFRFENLYSTATQTAFLVTILAEGHAMQSEYIVYEPKQSAKEFQFQLTPAMDKTLIVNGPNGQPLANAWVWPCERKSDKGGDYLIYDQSGVDTGYKTDAAGKLRMSLFEPGDKIHLRTLRNQQWESIRFTVDDKPEQIVGASTQSGVRGTVADASGKPVSKATVLLIRKSWPDGRFQQEPFVTQTDAQGNYRFADANVPDEREAVLVTAIKDGLAFQSRYVIKKGAEEFPAFDFSLKPAVKKTILLRDADGKPLAKHSVAPFRRKTSDAVEHLIYAISARSIASKTDDDGKVSLNVFESGDTVDLLLLSADDAETLKLQINDQSEQTVNVGTGSR